MSVLRPPRSHRYNDVDATTMIAVWPRNPARPPLVSPPITAASRGIMKNTSIVWMSR